MDFWTECVHIKHTPEKVTDFEDHTEDWLQDQATLKFAEVKIN